MTDYEKLKALYNEIDVLIERKVDHCDNEFEAWHSKAKRFIQKKYGKDSVEFEDFDNTDFSLRIWTMNTPRSSFVKACIDGLTKTKIIFQSYLEEMEHDDSSDTIYEKYKQILDYSKIFIVHGHDGELKESVARLIEKQDIEAIILTEKANQGRTIIEKFENYSDVAGAICLFTADDLGKANDEEEYKARARQNVVFETGFFIGKLGRSNVIIIADSSVEMPSDLSGVVYTNKANWQLDIIKELKAIGYNVDANKLL